MKIKLMLLYISVIYTNTYAQTFTLKSNELSGQATENQIFNGFGCTGKNISPQLYWENAPAHTQSFAITLYDPDAPTGSGWWHWIIFDIPSGINQLPSNTGNPALQLAPKGSIQSITDFKSIGYGGPCPPQGSKPHKYIMTLYALKTEKLGLDATANPALAGFMLEQNVIAKSSLIFYHQQ
ncbi:MAG TPA: YbhB/YbcL family Raf kinase inhibitor-like protein [Phnomibacter sp.]|nr:YbhB/YbcL family Raf kinase inhibitor-like protein [Phnomibacter sp.]